MYYNIMSLIHAIENNDIDLVRQLLDNGIDINLRDSTGNTALMWASQEGHNEIVELLLIEGADVNNIDLDGDTALMLASQEGHTDIMKLLLNSGADPNIQDFDGDTLIMTLSFYGYIENIELLLDSGANTTIRDINGDTALMLASKNGHTDIVELLERHVDQDVLIDAVRENNIVRVKQLLDRGVFRRAAHHGMQEDEEALFFASEEGHLEIVRLLLDAGVDPNIQEDSAEKTALILASEEGYLEVVRLLLDRGADLNILDEHGNTALFYASEEGHLEVVELLERYMNTLKHLNKLKAAKTIQSKIRGKQTRKKKYIDRFKSYKPWKGTEAFNVIMYDDEDVFNYLRENDRNFVIKLLGSDNYEAWNIDDYLKTIEIEGVDDINVFYECYEASRYTPEDNINRDTIYTKLGSSNFVVEMPDWILSSWRNIGPNNKIPEPRIFGLVENKMVNALVSTLFLHYDGGLVSSDHCNQREPIMTYKLELLSEETIIADYLNTLNLEDQYGGYKRTMKKRYRY